MSKKTNLKVSNISYLTLLHNFQQCLNSGYAQIQILLTVCQRFAMMRISDRGPGWKQNLTSFVIQLFRKNILSSSYKLRKTSGNYLRRIKKR